MQLCPGAKVTPFRILSWDPLLLPLTELFLMIPGAQMSIMNSERSPESLQEPSHL